ncbi:Cullin-1 (OsCUL1) (OsCUL1-1) [Durusdinium trenchii]|uniref:Cullin-1 (OsCUL1) (OsCUL1-1) n=1 Tax=Durusdinium trenchii TaxID=1381693 RepID=A0ABP0IR93_9DINO
MGDRFVALEDGWAAIKSAIDKLIKILSEDMAQQSKAFTTIEYVEVYTKCYDMCTQRSPHNWSEELYTRHGVTIENYFTEQVVPVLQGKRDEYLLKEMVLRWKNHEIMDKWMRKFFMYLDRYYVKHHSIPTLHESSLEKFRTLVFEQVKDEFVGGIVVQINKEREGEIVDRGLLKDCVAVFGKMSDKLKIYEEALEKPLLESSKDYYLNKSQDWIAEDTLPVYLRKAEAALETERERVDNYLEADSKPKLVKVVETELLKEHEKTLLEKEGSGCRALLEDDKREDLARLFMLFDNVEDGLEPIAAIVKEHITKKGEDIVEKREAAMAAAQSHKEREALDPAFVQALLDLHDKYRTLIDNQFQGHSLFQKALKEACEVFINHDVGKTSNAELISSFADRVLKTGGQKLSESEVEDNLERCVQLFSYLSDKDLFCEVYRNQLAKRLLNSRSASDDAERSMISKLKLRCGAQYTARLEGMVKDLLTGDDFKKSFKEHVATNAASLLGDKDVKLSAQGSGECVTVGNIEFSVDVLTTGHWPSYKMVNIVLPREFDDCMDVYKKFYASKTSHRCLKWVFSLGNATVRAAFKRPYDIQVTTLQAVALLAFNGVPDDQWVSLQEIMGQLNLEEEVAKRVMHSLSCSKHKVLEKEPKSKGISRDDKFRVNAKFQSPMRKIRIPMASLDQSHNPKRVQEDRSIAIEAAVVRIMKARKRMNHTALITEVLAQLHFFKPAISQVKRRIEHLIDREYLERDEEEANVYKYLA